MRIAQLSDLHVTRPTWNPFRLFSKRILGNLNWLFTRNSQFSEDLLTSLIDLFNSLKVDLVLLGGDFTTTALPEEFKAAKSLVKKIKSPYLALPGNHDSYTYKSFREKHFYRYFTNNRAISHPLHFFTLENQGVEAHNIAPNWWTILLDTAVATPLTSSQGLFSVKTENYLHEVLEKIPEDHRVILVNHYPFFQNDKTKRTLQRGDALEKLIRGHYPKIALYLHGHTHRNISADLRPNRLPIILDSGCSTQVKGGSWNLLDLSESKLIVTSYHYQKKWEPRKEETFSW